MNLEVLANGKYIDPNKFLVHSKANIIVNNSPIVNAGVDKGMTLPFNSLHITGTASDPDGSIVSYLWTKASGPTATLNGTNTLVLNASGLVAGTYIFRLTVIDNLGASAFDDVQLIVHPAPTGGDIQPPATIANLTATVLSSSSIRLNWTAPGDDGTTGTAAVYDIRYSKTPISIQNFTSGGYPPGVPAPSIAGTAQTITIAGLEPNTTYYFAMVARDESGNQSALSNVPFAQTQSGAPSTTDTQAPAAIANLTATVLSSTSIRLSWTAPGDDGATGTATVYDIRYSKTPLNIANFTSGIYSPGIPSPAVGGTPQMFNIVGLESNTTYYFAMVARDEAGNQSNFSNVASAITLSSSFTVNAGKDETLLLPENSITLNGSAVISEGTISSYQWTKESGPTVIMNGGNSATLSLSNLVKGSYVFRLSVTNNNSQTFWDELNLKVNTNLDLDSLALVDLYIATDGTNWLDNEGWLEENLNNWNGIEILNNRVSEINLNENNLNGPLPNSIGQLSQLKELIIHENGITSIPKSIYKLTNLEILSTEWYNTPILDSISKMIKLKELAIVGNFETLPNSFSSLSQLESLNLQSSYLNKIPESISSLVNLKSLALGENLTYIPKSFKNLKKLSSITLLGNLQFEDIELFLDNNLPNLSIDYRSPGYTSLYRTSNQTLSVYVRGANNMYQWKKNGVVISGETKSQLKITSQDINNNNNLYECIITNTKVPDLIITTTQKKLSEALSSLDPKSFNYTANYNGNISAIKWNVKYGNISSQEKVYAFAYDKLNRLTDSYYSEKENSTGTWHGKGNYNEEGISYDLNGNILKLRRFDASLGSGRLMDNLNYKYVGNQLSAVNDSAISLANALNGFEDLGSVGDINNPEYVYNENGNLIEDKNKKIRMFYNDFNLIDSVSFGKNNYILYIYNGVGVKLAKEIYQNNKLIKKTLYNGELVFENNALDFIITSEGRAKKIDSGFKYEYFLKDHLGNTRVSFDEYNGVARVIQSDNYYPFGLKLGVSYDNSSGNLYTYNGKELQNDAFEGISLGVYDYGSRMYNPVTGRWSAVDPYSSMFYNFSPYNYVFNSPINYIDKEGEIPIPIILGLFGAAGGAAYGIWSGKSLKATLALAAGGFVAGATLGLGTAGIGILGGATSIGAATTAHVAAGTAYLGAANVAYITMGTAIVGNMGGELVQQTIDVLTGEETKYKKYDVLMNGLFGLSEVVLGPISDVIGGALKEGTSQVVKEGLTYSYKAENAYRKELIKSLMNQSDGMLTRAEAKVAAEKLINIAKETNSTVLNATITVTDGVVDVTLNTATTAGGETMEGEQYNTPSEDKDDPTTAH